VNFLGSLVASDDHVHIPSQPQLELIYVSQHHGIHFSIFNFLDLFRLIVKRCSLHTKRHWLNSQTNSHYLSAPSQQITKEKMDVVHQFINFNSAKRAVDFRRVLPSSIILLKIPLCVYLLTLIPKPNLQFLIRA
jgi:hypothetical protein